MKVVAVTQARYGSMRLPAKVLRKVDNATLLDIHLKRILKSKKISELVVATTNESGAEKIVEIANNNNVKSYRGSIDDVLGRFYFAVKDLRPDYVVRVTSDCPLIDPVVIDRVIEECIDKKCEYASNTLKPTYPDGIDTEVFTFAALEKTFKEASLKSDREHVTPYIKRNSSFNGGALFTSCNVVNKEDYSKYRITVDTPEDFEVIKALILALGVNASWREYVDYLDNNKSIKDINSNHKRDEGYAKSLLND